MYNRVKTIILTAIITFLCTSILFTFIYLHQRDKADVIKRIILDNYDGDIEAQKMDEYAAKGVVESLGDMHSIYFTKDEFDAFYSELTGNYKGIGIEIYLNELNQMEIISVFPDTPAYDAGLLKGDIIKSVDSMEITLENYSEVIRFMRGISEEGKAAETFNITIEREGEEIQKVISRSNITVPTISSENIGEACYISVSMFNGSTENDFKSAVDSALKSGCKGLIIDLRDNPGGELNTVVNIADYFLPEGTIVYTSDKNGKTQYYNSDSSKVDIPIVLLINENSASASEILAAALHDNNKAKLIGEKTYGKGSVQNIIGFNDGTALKLTIAHYYTPAGVCIDGVGIEPDYEVSLPDDIKDKPVSRIGREDDIQLQKAIEVLNN